MDSIDGIEDNTEYTEQIFSALANTRLLYNHSASWEFLIAQRLLQDGPDEEKSVYNPVSTLVIAFCASKWILIIVDFRRF